MKRQAKPHEQSRTHVRCPFYDHVCTKPEFQTLTWCGNCYVEYYRARSGKIIFDTQRKTPGWALAKALNKSGGTSL